MAVWGQGWIMWGWCWVRVGPSQLENFLVDVYCGGLCWAKLGSFGVYYGSQLAG